MTLAERVKRLEKNLAEMAEVVARASWGTIDHNRAFDLVASTSEQAEMEHAEPVKPVHTGRKFR